MQNSKNHEEEVQLRLKFESKLNSMHSIHRELEIKHRRLINDYDTAEGMIQKHEGTIKEQSNKIIQVVTLNEEQQSRIKMLEERRDALDREIILKARIVNDCEEKVRRMQDEMDLKVYHIID